MTKLRLSPPSLRSVCAAAQVIYDIIYLKIKGSLVKGAVERSETEGLK